MIKKTKSYTQNSSNTEKKETKNKEIGTYKKEVKDIKNEILSIKNGIKEIKKNSKENDDNEKNIEKNVIVVDKDTTSKEEKMYVIPLGGLEEVGKNITVIQYRDEIIIIDSGVTFPDENLLGIDLVIPDFSFLENNKDKIKGLFVTHGHEDHIGSIPYLYQKIDNTVPIYGGKLTLALIKAKFDGPGFLKDLPKMKEVKGRSKIKIGKYFSVEFIKVTHSIADAYGIYITTPAGTILHTGDFKIDLTPVDNITMDFARLSQIGESGVDFLLSDSTNADLDGFTPSERTVGEAFKQEFSKAKGRIIVAAFASHIHRLQQIVSVAEEYKRKIAIDGRSLVKVFEIAVDLGYLKMNKDTMISLNEVDRYDNDKVVIICTGTQGEPMAALSRIAKNMHKFIKIQEGDTVIISATPIPGNEKAVSDNINNLLKFDADVIFKKIAGIHVSGHGSKEELSLMLNLIKPKYFMPVHGEYKMLKAHKLLAMETGIPKENIIIAQNGCKIEVTQNQTAIKGKVNAGFVLVDGLGVGDIGNIVLKDRQQLSQDGVVIIVMTLNKNNGMIVAGPEIMTRGFIYVKESDDMIKEAIDTVKERLLSSEMLKNRDMMGIKSLVRDVASKYFYGRTKREPMILPVIMEV